MYETRLNSRGNFPYALSFPVYLRWKRHMKKMKYKWRTNQEKTAVFRHLEFYSRTLILSHQTLGPLHFASRYSMTQILKDKQLMKGKKRERKMSSWNQGSLDFSTRHFNTLFHLYHWHPGDSRETSKLWPLLTLLLRKMLQKFHSSSCPLFFHKELLL